MYLFLENDDKATKLAVDDNECVGGSNSEQRSACISPASSQGGIYPVNIYKIGNINLFI